MNEDLMMVFRLVMPWLNPQDLSYLACTCSAMASAVAALNSLRIRDAARGLEPWPVPILNSVDSFLYPYFAYTPFSCIKPAPSQPWGLASQRAIETDTEMASRKTETAPCTCTIESNEPEENTSINHSNKKPRLGDRSFPCGRMLDGGFAYDEESKLDCLTSAADEDVLDDFLLIMECGPACSCDLGCKYRVSQRGLAVKVSIVRDSLKGWSLRASQFISIGSFVFEYAGELLTTSQAKCRQTMYDKMRKSHRNFAPSLLVLREHLPSGRACMRVNIDATFTGNVAKFVNHSCDGGNLQPCIIRMTGSFIPKLVFFARKDIAEGEELTFSYGDEIDGLQSHPCFCATSACKGFLPFEET